MSLKPVIRIIFGLLIGISHQLLSTQIVSLRCIFHFFLANIGSVHFRCPELLRLSGFLFLLLAVTFIVAVVCHRLAFSSLAVQYVPAIPSAAGCIFDAKRDLLTS